MADNSRGRYRGFSESRRAANARYDKKMAHVTIRMTQEKKEALQAHCTQIGESMNSFINSAIQQKMDSSGK